MLKVSNIVVTIAFLFITMTTQSSSLTEQQLARYKNKRVKMTVFIHGMMNIKFHLSFKNAIHFMSDTVHNTMYAKTIDVMRQNSFFYINQVMSRYGLIFIDPTHLKTNEYASRAISYIFDTFEQINLEHTVDHDSPLTMYYTFGWNGLLSKKERMWAACDLFEALEKEIIYLKKHNITADIRIVGYSHGGNIALCLSHAHQHHFPESTLKINELILVGTPIKKDIDFLIHDPLFEKVYNIYSGRDRVQKIDLISRNQIFSSQTFKPRKNFFLPEKLTQIKIKITRLRKHHDKDFVRLSECGKDVTKKSIRLGRSPLLRDTSPGHMELWFFGWTPLHYRPHFPLYPMPAVSLVPYLINTINKLNLTGAHVTVDIRPESELSVIMHHDCSTYEWFTTPFITCQQLNQIKENVLSMGPTEHLCIAEYNENIKKAFHEAELIMLERKCLENEGALSDKCSRLCTHDCP